MSNADTLRQRLLCAAQGEYGEISQEWLVNLLREAADALPRAPTPAQLPTEGRDTEIVSPVREEVFGK